MDYPDWQPISTAPKDGTRVIVWNDPNACCSTCPACRGSGGGRLCVYHAHGEGIAYAPIGVHVAEWGGAWVPDQDEGGRGLPDWWFVAGEDFEYVLNPTHWLPLPPPPKPEDL